LNRVAAAVINRRCELLATAGCLAILALGTGCETDSYMDPSRTGYFEWVPTTMPVLKRLDVIESVAFDNAIVGPPEPEDLLPNTHEYIFGPGDVVVVEIYELVARGETEKTVRTIDPDGYIRLPVIGSVPAAGLTIQALVDSVKQRLVTQNIIIRNPIVNITPEETRSYQYKIIGSVERGGLFALNRPDLRLTDALALAQGAYPTTQKIRIVRAVQDLRTVPPEQPQTRPGLGSASGTNPSAVPSPVPAPGTTPPTGATPDIESLIDQLNIKGGSAPAPSAKPAGAAPPNGSQPIEPAPPSPGALRDDPSAPPVAAPRQANTIDIDSLEPVRIADAPTVADAHRQAVTTAPPSDGTTFVFDQERQEWVRVRAGTAPPPGTAPHGARTGPAAAGTRSPNASRYSGPPTRVIEIAYEQLLSGVPGLDVVIRPGDLIVADAGDRGVVYIDGEVQRPGVYQLPEGGRLTVSRLIAAAGGLNQIAIPERCDLIRKVGEDREAAIRISVAAIRNRGEPDIYCKPDDHIIIGTNFWATPLAVIRNGFRMTYGFGFLLDRNFGNDVFGAPPVNVVGE